MHTTKLVIGLGNPGATYEGTRHNIGFSVLDNFANKLTGKWKTWQDSVVVFKPAEYEGVLFAKPMSFMNLSGHPVKKLLDYYKYAPSELCILLDDFSINLGEFRLRLKGSSGGHNGLQSIIDHIGTEEIPRLRVGIGPVSPEIPTPDFVLSKFLRSDVNTVKSIIAASESILEKILEKGVEYAASTIKPVEIRSE